MIERSRKEVVPFRLSSQFQNTLVVMVETDSARLFEVSLEGMKAESSIESYVPGRHEQGGWAQMRYQRHIKDHMDGHHKFPISKAEPSPVLCPLCRGESHGIDLGEEMTRAVLRRDGEARWAEDSDALKNQDGVGASLRFR